MAECQTPFAYAPDVVRELKNSLSDPRFHPFRMRAGFKSDELAFEYYLYNARLSKSLLFPIHVCEVTVRNAISRLFSTQFNPAWWRDPAFLDLLTSESKRSLEKVVEHRHHAGKTSTDDIVAGLSLDFWSNLFRPEYEDPIWKHNLAKLLPHSTATFADLGSRLKTITRQRNRIAHHESILNTNIQELLSTIHFVLKEFSPVVLSWVKGHSTVHLVLRTKPESTAIQAFDVGSRADTKFTALLDSDTLSKLPIPMDTPCVIFNAEEKVVAVVDGKMVANYILGNSEDWCLLDFGNATVADLMKFVPTALDFHLVSAKDSAALLPGIFKAGASHVVVVDPATDGVLGVIAKAHRRY